MKHIGTLKEIYRYPVKGMRGEALQEAQLGPRGIEGDRRFGFLLVGSLNPFPWLSGSKMPAVTRYVPKWIGEDRSGENAPGADKAIAVRTPFGDVFALSSEELRKQLSAEYGSPVQLARLWRGIFDENPISLFGSATLNALSEETGVPLDACRFRTNLVVETSQPFVEETWIGRQIVFGEAADAPTVHGVMRDIRCSQINIHPDTAENSPQVLKTVVKRHDNRAGIYADPARPGVLHVGTGVYLV